MLKEKLVLDKKESRAQVTPEQAAIDQSIMDKINRYALTPLTKDQIYVRSMYIVNDQIDSYDSQFTATALQEIAALIPGESVMKGHDYDGLPIARFFDAVVTQKPDSTGLWVRAWFYWLKGTTGAEDMLRNIDGGIYKEVSLGWRYDSSICSICGEDMRKCPHIPGEEYDGKRCYYQMSDIKEVLEGSLVFKGGQNGTSLAGERSKDQVEPPANDNKAQKGSDNMSEQRIKELEKEKADLAAAKTETELRAQKLEEQVTNYRKALNKQAVADLRFTAAAKEALKLEDHLNALPDNESEAMRSMLKVIDGLASEGRLIDPSAKERMVVSAEALAEIEARKGSAEPETLLPIHKQIVEDIRKERK